MTSHGPKRGGEEPKSKLYRIESFTNTSDDESEEMNRIREKLQRRRHNVVADDDTLSSVEETTMAIAEPAPWTEDDDDDAFDAKLAAMNVFPSIIDTGRSERPSEAEHTFIERSSQNTRYNNELNGEIPSLQQTHQNDHPEAEEEFFSDDDDLIAAIECSATTWTKPNGMHFEDEAMGDPQPLNTSIQEGNRRDNSKQASSRSVAAEPYLHRHCPTETIKDQAAVDSNNLYGTNPMVRSPNSRSILDFKQDAPWSDTQSTTRDKGLIPPLSKQKKVEQQVHICKGTDKENVNPEVPHHRSNDESRCLYEYVTEHQDWNSEEDWIIYDSDTESTPSGTNSADPFGFDTEHVARSKGCETHQLKDPHTTKTNEFMTTFSGENDAAVKDGANSKKHPERFLDDAFGFPAEVFDTIPSKSNQGPDSINEQLQVDPSSESDTPDEKHSEVDPCLYAPQAMDAIQEPIIHHLSPRNRPIQSRRKIPISQIFQGPVASLWKNKFDVFNHVQSEIANMLAYSDDNVVVSAPTGAGKTAVFEMAMARFFEVDLQATPPGRSEKMVISKRRKIVYMSPSKALCDERFADWSKRLSAMNLGIEIAVVTGDGDPSDAYHDLASSHFIITTPEKWDSLTRRWTEKFFLFASVKLFLVDEVHLIGDKSRGCCLEAVICRMKAIQRAASQINVSQTDINASSFANTSPDAINTLLRFVAVSATLPNIADIAMFFEANEAFIFDESYRPVPLTIHVIGQGKLNMDASNGQFMFWKNLDRNVPELIFRFSNQRPTIVFCHSKADCEKLADLLATTQNVGRRDDATSGMASRTRVSKLQRVLLQGIAYHHAGLEVEDRRLIEESFTQGKIRVICATSTIAMGVNLPAHLVIIKGTSAYRGSGEGGGYQDIDQASLLQMIGRAGRPGFDTTGTAVIMTDNDSKARFEHLASSGLGPAMSQLKGLKLVETINTEVSQRVICSTTNAINWIKGTLYFLQLSQDPAGHGVKVVSNYSIDTHLHNMCRNAIDRLCAIGTLAVTESQDIYPLPASHIMSQRLVAYEAMAQISKLPFDVSHSQVIKTLSKIEGMHCPVRRNEKKALNSTHKSLKMYKLEGPLSKVRIQEPWQKSFVLLQAYIDVVELEEHDFAMKKEMNAMVEYAARTLTAIEEYSIKGTKNGNVAFQCMKIRRSLAVRLWSEKDGMLQQIKGIGKAMAFSLHMNGISTFEDVMKSSEAQLEKAVSRPHPFGSDLRHACASILQSRLKISAQVDRTKSTHILFCTLRRACETTNEDRESFEKPSTVTYTLLAYTDRAGGLLLVKQNIVGPGSHHVTLPQGCAIITIQLVASIVGLDDILELGEVNAKPPIQNNQKNREVGEHARTRIRNAKPRNQLTRSSPKDVSVSKFNKKSNDSVTVKTSSRVPLPTQIIGSRRIQVLPENTTVTPSPKLIQQPSLGKSPARTVSQHDARIRNVPGKKDPNKERNSEQNPPSPEFHPFKEVTFTNASIKRKLESAYIPTETQHTNEQVSWKRIKSQQQKSQQRAFVRQSDNPFKSYKHDPNDSESYLDSLTSQVKKGTSSSIIPPEGFHALRSIHAAPAKQGYGQRQEHHSADHRATPRVRGFHENHALPIPEILSQKANESNFHSAATTLYPSYVQMPPRHPCYQNQYPQVFPIYPDHFNSTHFVSAPIHDPSNLYLDTNYQGHFHVDKQPSDNQSMYASMRYYEAPYVGHPQSHEYAYTTSLEGLASGYNRGMHSSQHEPFPSNANTYDWTKKNQTHQHIAARCDILENDVETAFF